MSGDEQPPLKKRKSSLGPDEAAYTDSLKACSVIATPMASRKQVKKLYKLVRKASIESSAKASISGEGGKKNGLKTCAVRRGIRSGNAPTYVFCVFHFLNLKLLVLSLLSVAARRSKSDSLGFVNNTLYI